MARWLEHLECHLPIARTGEDDEGVHQLRVAAARLDVWLRLGRRRLLRDDLRWLRRGAGDVRDLDVLIAGGGPAPFLAELRSSWESARASMLAVLGHPRLEGLLAAIRAEPPIDRRRAGKESARWSRRLGRVGRSIDWRCDPLEALHSFRKRVRRVRYAREWLGETAAETKSLATLLGDLHDEAVLLDRLRGGDVTLVAAGSSVSEAEVEERIAALRGEAEDGWKRAWEEMRGEA